MKTFQLQYYTNHWKVYKDDENFPIEFIALGAAKTVAKDLSAHGFTGGTTQTIRSHHWKIVDSTGNEHFLV